MSLYDKEMNKLMLATWWVVLLRGICIGIVSLLMLFWTGPALFIAILFAGGFLFVSGVWAAIGGFLHRKGNSKWWLDIIIGIIGVIAGLFVVFNPLTIGAIAPELLVILMAAFALISGILEIYKGVHIRREGHKDGSHIIVGVGYLLVALILMLMPMMDELVVGLLIYGFGFFLLFIAFVLIWYAFVLRGYSKQPAEISDDELETEDSEADTTE
jgi:uncharacterized membrane protein HdeD (DUF308 family)